MDFEQFENLNVYQQAKYLLNNNETVLTTFKYDKFDTLQIEEQELGLSLSINGLYFYEDLIAYLIKYKPLFNKDSQLKCIIKLTEPE